MTPSHGNNRDRSCVYEIRVEGHLSRYHARQFEGMAISCNEQGETVMTGPVADQAALHGLLGRIRDLAVPLLLVRRLPGSEIPEEQVNNEVEGNHDGKKEPTSRNLVESGC
jgi:hypothetical protein